MLLELSLSKYKDIKNKEFSNSKMLIDAILDKRFTKRYSDLLVPIGSDNKGNLKFVNLFEKGSILFSCSSSQDCAMALDSLLLSLIYKFNPNEIKLILTDAFYVEFPCYNTLPHLLYGSVHKDKFEYISAFFY